MSPAKKRGSDQLDLKPGAGHRLYCLTSHPYASPLATGYADTKRIRKPAQPYVPTHLSPAKNWGQTIWAKNRMQPTLTAGHRVSFPKEQQESCDIAKFLYNNGIGVSQLKFFNIDMHISVIHDVQHIFQDLGHGVTRASLSGHNWVTNSDDGGIKYPSRANWTQIGPKMVEKFYRKYRDKLSGYDAFVHSFPPAFALLFEPFKAGCDDSLYKV